MKLALQRVPLGVLTALTMAVLLVVSVILVFLGVVALESTLERRTLDRLPSDASAAYLDFNAGRMPTQDGVRALLNSLPAVERQSETEGQLTILALAMIVALVGSLFGYWLARKISRPLEVLAVATENLRAGDFSVRVGPVGNAAKEVALLVRRFDALASELESMESRLRFNTMAVAHELRTPLTVLRGNLQGMADGVFPIDRTRIVQLLLQVEGLSALVEDLRTLSLAAGQKLVTQRLPLDLSVEVGQVLEASGHLLEKAGMTVETALQPVRIVGDAPRLRQAVLALVENATRYAAAGGVLRCEVGLQGGQEACIRLLDRGPGLPEDVSSDSVDLFWRADTSRSRATGGSGLGLSVVKAIAAAHDGRLEFANRPGGGAIVSIILPVEADA